MWSPLTEKKKKKKKEGNAIFALFVIYIIVWEEKGYHGTISILSY